MKAIHMSVEAECAAASDFIDFCIDVHWGFRRISAECIANVQGAQEFEALLTLLLQWKCGEWTTRSIDFCWWVTQWIIPWWVVICRQSLPITSSTLKMILTLIWCSRITFINLSRRRKRGGHLHQNAYNWLSETHTWAAHRLPTETLSLLLFLTAFLHYWMMVFHVTKAKCMSAICFLE